MPIRQTSGRARPPKVDEVKMPPQWSYSRWSTYDQCPYRAKLQYIDGLSSGTSDATERGTEVHSMAEDWLKSKKEYPLPPVFGFFKKEFQELRKRGAASEHEWIFDKDWNVIKDMHGRWLLVRIDAICNVGKKRIKIIDFKTGKIRDSHEKQMSLYALAAFEAIPEVEEVETELWYIDQHHTARNLYLRTGANSLKSLWIRRITPMFNDRIFAPNPSRLCGWCPFSEEKGGPCVH